MTAAVLGSLGVCVVVEFDLGVRDDDDEDTPIFSRT